MRADNNGEGGILALLALILQKQRRDADTFRRKMIIALGLIGAALLYGDGVITPAISVLSAVEGLEVVAPGSASLVIPITIAILLVLFFYQDKGTAKVGRIFGPSDGDLVRHHRLSRNTRDNARAADSGGTESMVRGQVFHRSRCLRVRAAWSGRACRYWCGSAVRGHGTFRKTSHSPRLVRPRPALPARQLFRTGRAHSSRSECRGQSFLPAWRQERRCTR